MREIEEHGQIGLAALRAGMHRNTARVYVASGQLPSESVAPRRWRTREDPFAQDWPELAERLAAAPSLEAKALFEDLLRRRPGRYQAGQVRTFQRRVQQWRATEGPERSVFFAQNHRPGEALQTDFTWAGELAVTIGGEPFDHLLCQSVLPYSNWQSVTVSHSESMLALKRGVQTAVFRLGRVPRWHQTDNSTAATHDLRTGKRGFNEEYAALMRHLGMEPRTIGIGESQQNGDIEAANGVLKRCLEQHLLLRGHRDFESVAAYEAWIDAVMLGGNGLRTKRLEEELAAMKALTEADRQHLLLAAGQMCRDLVAPLVEARKHGEHRVGRPRRVSCRLLAVAGLARRHHQVLAHGQALEDAAPLRHQRDAARGDLLRRLAADRRAEHGYRAAARRQQAHGDVHAGRLAGAVAAEQPEHAGLMQLERDVLQHVAVAVIGVDIGQRERASGQDRPPGCAGRPPPGSACPPRSPRRNATA